MENNMVETVLNSLCLICRYKSNSVYETSVDFVMHETIQSGWSSIVVIPFPLTSPKSFKCSLENDVTANDNTLYDLSDIRLCMCYR